MTETIIVSRKLSDRILLAVNQLDLCLAIDPLNIAHECLHGRCPRGKAIDRPAMVLALAELALVADLPNFMRKRAAHIALHMHWEKISGAFEVVKLLGLPIAEIDAAAMDSDHGVGGFT